MYNYLYKDLAGITVTSRISDVENCQHIDILYQSVLSTVDNFVLYIWYLIFIIQQDFLVTQLSMIRTVCPNSYPFYCTSSCLYRSYI